MLIRLQTMPHDNVGDTRRKYLGLLNERVAKKRLAIKSTADPEERKKLRREVLELLGRIQDERDRL